MFCGSAFLLYKLSERLCRRASLLDRMGRHSEANRYEQEATLKAARECEYRLRVSRALESAKKPVLISMVMLQRCGKPLYY